MRVNVFSGQVGPNSPSHLIVDCVKSPVVREAVLYCTVLFCNELYPIFVQHLLCLLAGGKEGVGA